MVSLAVYLYLAGLVGLVGIAYYVFASFLYGAGYQPTPRASAERMLDLANLQPGDRLFDLGAGTGTLLFRAADRTQADVTGFEIEPIRFLILKLRRGQRASRDRIHLERCDFFHRSFRGATVVTTFLWPGAMEKLKPKLRAELAPGARVISYYHPIKGWRPAAVDKPLRVFLYRAPFPDDNPAPASGESGART